MDPYPHIVSSQGKKILSSLCFPHHQPCPTSFHTSIAHMCFSFHKMPAITLDLLCSLGNFNLVIVFSIVSDKTFRTSAGSLSLLRQ